MSATLCKRTAIIHLPLPCLVRLHSHHFRLLSNKQLTFVEMDMTMFDIRREVQRMRMDHSTARQ